MLVATKVHENEPQWKKNEQEHVWHFLHEWVTRKFLEVSRCSRAKQQKRNVQKSVLHVQSCFFAN